MQLGWESNYELTGFAGINLFLPLQSGTVLVFPGFFKSARMTATRMNREMEFETT